MPTSKFTKKRPATSRIESPAKKEHLDKSLATPKRRSRPVTHPRSQEGTSSASESESEPAEVEDDEPEGLQKGDDQNESSRSAEHDNKEPTAAREVHKAQKILQQQRKANKPHSTLLNDAKRIWGLARQKNISSNDRQKHIEELVNVIHGKVKEVVLKHDASRIIQTIVKYGRQKQRDQIATELKGQFRDLAQNKYSKFLVTKLIRLCPSHRTSILMEFQSHVLRLLLHREASSVLSDAFELYANAYERSILIRDFYGKEVALFTVTKSTGEDRERSKRGLRGVLEGANAEHRNRILNATKDSLTTIFNNPDKGAVTHAIVHRALWEYLTAVNDYSDEAECERRRREIFECCQDVFAEMVHTKDGSRVVREFLAQGNAKDRKVILKALKPHIIRMCQDDEAQLVLFTALDVIDDTKLSAKCIVNEITSSAATLVQSPQGRRSLLYLIVPRCRRHFTPAQISSLAETDEIRVRTSKKDNLIREAEVREAASEGLVKWIVDNIEGLIRDPGGSLVVTDIMLFATSGDKQKASQALLEPLSSPYPSSDPSKPHLIDLPHVSRLYKVLLQGGHFNHSTKQVELASSWDNEAFAEGFANTLGGELAVSMCTQGDGNGAFVMAELCETLRRGSKSQQVKGWFSQDVMRQIEEGQAKGKKVLLGKIAAL